MVNPQSVSSVESTSSISISEAQDEASSICSLCNIHSDILSASCPTSEGTRNVVTQQMDLAGALVSLYIV